MIFHIEERKAWFRPTTHTFILEGDPDYERFSGDPSGERIRLLRVWAAEPSPRGPLPGAYLGSVAIGSSTDLTVDLLPLFRRAGDRAAGAGESVKMVRGQLVQAIREHLRKSSAE